MGWSYTDLLSRLGGPVPGSFAVVDYGDVAGCSRDVYDGSDDLFDDASSSSSGSVLSSDSSDPEEEDDRDFLDAAVDREGTEGSHVGAWDEDAHPRTYEQYAAACQTVADEGRDAAAAHARVLFAPVQDGLYIKRLKPSRRGCGPSSGMLRRFTHESLTICSVSEVVPESVYEARHINAERREAWSRVSFKVELLEDGEFYECECGLYTHFGILCCHAIAVIIHRGVSKIPQRHIMKRWTRDARDVLPPHLSLYQKDTSAMHSRTFRHSLLHTSAAESVRLGDTNLECYKVMMRCFSTGQSECQKLIAEIGEQVAAEPLPNYDSSDAERHRRRAGGYQSEPDMGLSGQARYGVSGVNASMTEAELSAMRPPVVVRTNGRPKVKRFLSPIEHFSKKRKTAARPGYVRQTRFCSVCHQSGHTMAGCPDNPNKKKRKSPRCSICGVSGHRSTNCFTKKPVLEEYEDSGDDCSS